MQLTVSTPSSEPLAIAPTAGDLAISPDGRRIAFVAAGPNRLQVRSLDQLRPATVVDAGRPLNPFFSPDREWLGFYDPTGPELKKVPVGGGATVTICDLPGNLRGASWAAGDIIVFATADPDSGLWQVGAGGGEPRPLTAPDHGDGQRNHLWPDILPGGDAVLFTITRSPINTSQIAVFSLDSGEQKVLVQGGSNPRYSSTGHLVYAVDGSLWAVRFDVDRLEIIGDPVTVVEGVLTKASGSADFSFSETLRAAGRRPVDGLLRFPCVRALRGNHWADARMGQPGGTDDDGDSQRRCPR